MPNYDTSSWQQLYIRRSKELDRAREQIAELEDRIDELQARVGFCYEHDGEDPDGER